MNAIDRLVRYFSPGAALRRHAARNALAYYEAGESSRLRKFHKSRGSANEAVQRGAVAVRTQARHLVRNHDLARGALRVLVNNVVGPNGIGVEPQPRRLDGSIHSDYAAALLEAWRDWCRTPEVTHRLPWSRLQRALARAWLRDGEVFAQMITGLRPDLTHGSRVPFSLEAFEADLVPLDLTDYNRNIVQGVERNTWGQPLAIHVLKTNPSDLGLPTTTNTKRIPWANMLHLATLDHIGQVRGVSEFASVITRLEDIKDYEESERVAAKIAAMLTAYVKKGQPDLYQPPESDGGPRQISLQPGAIIDDLGPGEEIGMIDSKRPNPNLITFRQGQLRAIAAGLGGSYSSISRDYNGTYSAQRQELVEQWVHYATLCDEFTGEVCRPVWEAFVEACHLSGVARRPNDLKPGTHNDALYTAQAMPWIDPVKEANAWSILVENGFASEVEAIRRRGANPRDVLEQIAEFRRKADELGVQLKQSQMPEPDPATLPPEPPPQAHGNPLQRDEVRARIDAACDDLERKIEAVRSAAPSATHVNVNLSTEQVNQALSNSVAQIVDNTNRAINEMTQQVRGDIQEMPIVIPAPVVNVTVEQPAIEPVIHVDVPPADIKLDVAVEATLPARKTDTTIIRDSNGNISRATQVETDL